MDEPIHVVQKAFLGSLYPPPFPEEDALNVSTKEKPSPLPITNPLSAHGAMQKRQAQLML
jgi:hypothetical protein